jgi:heme oxygenase
MSKIKELTWEHHKNAERQAFAKLLVSGNISEDLYATYLWNQHKKYDILEAMISSHGLFAEVGAKISRKTLMEADIAELWKHDIAPPVVPSTIEYIDHMRDIMGDRDKIIAHMYVFYLGDMSGGQMIKKKIPGEGRMYDFGENVNELKDRIRDMTTDEMAEEAQWVFSSATKLFEELGELNLERYLESSNTVSE